MVVAVVSAAVLVAAMMIHTHNGWETGFGSGAYPVEGNNSMRCAKHGSCKAQAWLGWVWTWVAPMPCLDFKPSL